MVKYQYWLVALIISLPAISYAQEASLQSLFKNLLVFFSDTLIPFLLGMAFLFFVINVFRYFILGGANEEAQKKAKSLAIYGVTAFVFLIIFFGLVYLLVETTGLEGVPAPTPDYNTRLQ